MAARWVGAVHDKTSLNPSPIRAQGAITPVFYYIVNCGKKSIINFKLAWPSCKNVGEESEQAFFLRNEMRNFQEKCRLLQAFRD